MHDTGSVADRIVLCTHTKLATITLHALVFAVVYFSVALHFLKWDEHYVHMFES